MAINRKILGPQSWRESPIFWWEAVRFKVVISKAKLAKFLRRTPEWPDIPDTPDQRALIERHNADFRLKHPGLVEIEMGKDGEAK